jgi:hypothetical protein
MQAAVPSLLFAGGIGLLMVSCGADSSSGPGGVSSPLECEARDYPCSLSEVRIEILERGDALGDEAVAMLEAGAATGDVAAFLERQADMAVVEWDHAAIWYRLKGGVGIWILREAAFAPEVAGRRAGGQDGGTGRQNWAAEPDGTGRRNRTERDDGTGRLDRAHRRSSTVSSTATPFYIVGLDSQKKKALVLSPFQWHVPDIEDTPAVAEILSATRGYEGGVTYRSNPEETSANVGLASFMEWDGYDVVHVSTHGSRVCSDGGCRATLVAGLLASVLPPGGESKAEKLKTLEEQGVSYAKSENTGREYLVLSADFFRYHYPGGLDDALVFINSCEGFGPQATDLVDAIRGSSSVVFGWSETVRVVDATAASTALYQALSKGYPGEVALEEIEDLATGQPCPCVEGSPAPVLRASPRGEGGDLRIREVITLMHPVSGQELTAADVVMIEGTVNDGEPDAVPWLVRVDGVKPELAGGMVVRVLVAGAQSDPVPLSEGQAKDEDQWTVSGVVLLPFDVEEDTPATFGARLDLHEGGVSEHVTDATIGGEGPIMGREWKLEAASTTGWPGIPYTPVTATGNLTLQLAPGQAASEPHPRYVVTGGTVTYDYNHTYYDCTYSAPVLTFEVTQDVSQESELRFDTTTNPVGYTGVIYTQGPEFQVTESCGGGSSTRTQRAANTWVLVQQGEPEPVSGDRRMITGTYLTEAGNGFFYRSDYSIRRVR